MATPKIALEKTGLSVETSVSEDDIAEHCEATDSLHSPLIASRSTTSKLMLDLYVAMSEEEHEGNHRKSRSEEESEQRHESR